jgi:hypothetical protein
MKNRWEMTWSERAAYNCNTSVPEFITPKQYIKDKVHILVNDFGIQPTEQEMTHLRTLTEERDIDRAIRTIINNHWDT